MMAERKAWATEEDYVLKHLVEDKHIVKWCRIAQIMDTEFKLSGRNGKQCRERYHNHLDPNISKEDWTKEEECQLIELQNKHGNKWAVIAQQIPGRTDNSVKNHFYSQMRKSIREINLLITKYLKREFRELKMAFIYKLTDFAEDRSKKVKVGDQSINISIEIKNKILDYSAWVEQEPLSTSQIELLRDLIKLIHNFNKNNKRKSVKTKRRRSPDQQEEEEEPEYAPQHKRKGEKQDKVTPTVDGDHIAKLQNLFEYHPFEQPLSKKRPINKNQSLETTDDPVILQKAPSIDDLSQDDFDFYHRPEHYESVINNYINLKDSHFAEMEYLE